MEATTCASFVQCIYEFQTLISGVLAIFAAVGTALAIWFSAQLPVRRNREEREELEKRRRSYAASMLSHEFSLLGARARQARGTIRTVIAANAEVTENTRAKTTLILPELLDDWETMSLLSREVFHDIVRLRRKVRDHNFDMAQAGGAFGADNFRQQILQRLEVIWMLAVHLSGELETQNRGAA